ncbi:transmembrane protein [Legionella rubrilucens]|uniref:Transmembrane protein n=1 Tax=Legionella rubrilucens TaxID=458 RepID=A0A0W0XM77_9GAMM|nr:DUF2165 domain-containing protein [Legionella rubrilucens]KTD45738.1 transmembrane protein [Legionella rubrilucens]
MNMPIAIRFVKILLVVSVALIATLIAWGNMADYSSNLSYVAKIMTMDDIFVTSTLRSRAMQHPFLVHSAFLIIILWECCIALLCWMGSVQALRQLKQNSSVFNASKATATLGLMLFLLLFALVFMTIGGEWFASWQSPQFNSITASNTHFAFLGIILLLWLHAD